MYICYLNLINFIKSKINGGARNLRMEDQVCKGKRITH